MIFYCQNKLFDATVLSGRLRPSLSLFVLALLIMSSPVNEELIASVVTKVVEGLSVKIFLDLVSRTVEKTVTAIVQPFLPQFRKLIFSVKQPN